VPRRYIYPLTDIGGLLLSVEKPARYSGGEFGRLAKKDAALQTLIAFPDLYEIGMSNQALKIIYNGLNRMAGVSCDRAFAPAPDFEKLLREQGLPLYGLDTGISLKSLDLFLVTLGYELGAGGALAMMDISGIPLHCADRGDDDPIVITGGPAVSNPLPYSSFFDAFWIGEAEAGFFDLAAELAEMKKKGQGRAALLDRIRAHQNIWTRGKAKARRALDGGFAGRGGEAAVFPIAGMKIVHSHGPVEIMRGCPNGCRFCHAGFWYRPQREKKAGHIIAEAEAMVSKGGYREISLSSLSSGDYTGIGELVESLNSRFRERHVSFQLPSLKVSTFSLSLLEKIAETRRSGLTFAVETPVDLWQLAINKTVSRDSVVDILREAKKHGWRGAKFYFMIGLPLPKSMTIETSEEHEIVAFIMDVGRRAGMHFNINVGIFVPKPHTPCQWAAQIDSEAAFAKLNYIRAKLKPLGHKVSISDPLISLLEGLLSRGDERAGPLLEAAFRAGSRLDAWQEYINKPVWEQILAHNRELIWDFLREKESAVSLPWQVIDSGVSTDFLRKELDISGAGECTPPCTESCANSCGVCGGTTRNSSFVTLIKDKGNEIKNTGVNAILSAKSDKNTGVGSLDKNAVNHSRNTVNGQAKTGPAVTRVLFTFSKEGSAVFHGHLGLIEMFSMAFVRAGLPVLYSQGFNPLVKLEIAAPLATGISAGAEIAAVDFSVETPPDLFAERLNVNLPEGILIRQAECFIIPSGQKKYSLSSLLWGFGYAGEENEMVCIPAADEKKYRQERLEHGASLFSLKRNMVLAKNIIKAAGNLTENAWFSYFDVYRFLYPNILK
jgi:radical SAM superfamily enzyme YgiQ (UPF0313 family)